MIDRSRPLIKLPANVLLHLLVSSFRVSGMKSFLSLPICLIFAVDFFNAQEDCCRTRIVSDAGALDGTYVYQKTENGRNPDCVNGCIYKRDEDSDEEFCFQEVDEGNGGTIEDQCGGSTDAFPTVKISTGTEGLVLIKLNPTLFGI